MNKTFAFILLSALLCACQSPSKPTQATEAIFTRQAQDTTGNLIIFYDKDIGSGPLMKAVNDSGASLVYEYKTCTELPFVHQPKPIFKMPLLISKR